MCEHGFTFDEVGFGLCQACNETIDRMVDPIMTAIDEMVLQAFQLTVDNVEQFDVYVTDVPTSLTITITDKLHDFVLVERGTI